MTQADLETDQETLRLRDAFRVFAWQVFESHLLLKGDLDQRYTRFYSRWTRSKIRSMDLSQLTELATERGFSIEQLLTIRECYYCIAQPYPPEFFLSD
ncbi:hypothetical protein QUA54_18745 [Microcoleus sp. MOSTC5]|uniref:hypothetical protein n=1 Tax=Microcoleus sp. MOSTC5 TaxID=3055378 RepID=UPI002FD6A259